MKFRFSCLLRGVLDWTEATKERWNKLQVMRKSGVHWRIVRRSVCMVVYAERNVAQTQDDQARGNVLGRVQVGTVYTEYILDHKAYHLLR